jgi:hypothetical protein
MGWFHFTTGSGRPDGRELVRALGLKNATSNSTAMAAVWNCGAVLSGAMLVHGDLQKRLGFQGAQSL